VKEARVVSTHAEELKVFLLVCASTCKVLVGVSCWYVFGADTCVPAKTIASSLRRRVLSEPSGPQGLNMYCMKKWSVRSVPCSRQHSCPVLSHYSMEAIKAEL